MRIAEGRGATASVEPFETSSDMAGGGTTTAPGGGVGPAGPSPGEATSEHPATRAASVAAVMTRTGQLRMPAPVPGSIHDGVALLPEELRHVVHRQAGLAG